jgi:hypothetical protein
MITAEQIKSNTKKFLDTNSKYGIFTQELLDFLGEDFYTAPASTSLDMYSCYPGGLLNHCFKSAKFAVKINELLPENMRTETSSILKCVFLSQVGKTFMFKLNDNEWQRKTLGKMYEFTDSDVSMKAGERSVYYATKFGVTLTEEEFQSLLNSDKDSDDKMAKYRSSNLSNVVRMGFELSIIEEKNGQKRN